MSHWIKGALGIAVALVAGCSSSGTSTFPPGYQFATDLRVLYSNPDYLAEYVDPNTAIYVKMSEPVDPTSISGITVKYTSGSSSTYDITKDGAASLSENNGAIVFTPSKPFPRDSGITMNLPASVRAASGKSMIPTNVTFFTGARMAGVGSVSLPGPPYVSSINTSSYYYGCMEFVVRFSEDISSTPRGHVDFKGLWGLGGPSDPSPVDLYTEILYGNGLQTYLMSVPQGFCPCSAFGWDMDVNLTIYKSDIIDLQSDQMTSDYHKRYSWGNDFSPQYCYY